jgi:hypothetical protein
MQIYIYPDKERRGKEEHRRGQEKTQKREGYGLFTGYLSVEGCFLK